MSAIAGLTCDNETSPRGAGHTAEGSDPQIAYTIGGLRVSVPTKYTSRTAHGAASELIASAHLLAKGYHVFRALSANCPVDLIAYRPGEQPLRVEVKSGASGSDTVNPSFARPSNDDWDLLVIVHSNGSVVLLPYTDSSANLKEAYFRAAAPLGIVRRVTPQLNHCKRRHEFTPENTGRNGKGNRFCRACEKIRRQERRA